MTDHQKRIEYNLKQNARRRDPVGKRCACGKVAYVFNANSWVCQSCYKWEVDYHGLSVGNSSKAFTVQRTKPIKRYMQEYAMHLPAQPI